MVWGKRDLRSRIPESVSEEGAGSQDSKAEGSGFGVPENETL